MHKYVNIVDLDDHLVKIFPTNVHFEKSASIQPRKSLSKCEGDSDNARRTTMYLRAQTAIFELFTPANFLFRSTGRANAPKWIAKLSLLSFT